MSAHIITPYRMQGTRKAPGKHPQGTREERKTPLCEVLCTPDAITLGNMGN